MSRILKIVGQMLLSGTLDYSAQQLRDSDKRLLLAVWDAQGLELSRTQRQIFMDKCTPPESVTRARRKLKPKYPASPEVDQVRFNKFRQYRQGELV